jgi:hypothetical protein
VPIINQKDMPSSFPSYALIGKLLLTSNTAANLSLALEITTLETTNRKKLKTERNKAHQINQFQEQ